MAKLVTEQTLEQERLEYLVWEQLGSLKTNFSLKINLDDMKKKLLDANPAITDLTLGDLLEAIVCIFRHYNSSAVASCRIPNKSSDPNECVVSLVLEVLPDLQTHLNRGTDI